MTQLAANTSVLLEKAYASQKRHETVARLFSLGWQSIAILLTAGVFDAVWPSPVWLRGLFMIVCLSLLVATLIRSWRRANTQKLWEEQVARSIETQMPDLDNALIHAVQFAHTAPGRENSPSSGPLYSTLINRELERAERAVATIPRGFRASSTITRRERNVLLIMLGLVVATATVFPRFYRYEFPRLLTFWRDTPPFTLTDFQLSPTSARIRSGQSITITLRVSGLRPHRIELLTASSGHSAQSVTLTQTEEGVYSAQLERLTSDTWFMASADTGRSKRYWIYIDHAPHVRKMTATYHPPVYAKRPSTTVEVGANGVISGLFKTVVDFEVEADQPLSASTLTIDRPRLPALTVALTPIPGSLSRAKGVFEIEQDGDFHVQLMSDSSGGVLKTPIAATGKIVLQRDERPTVSITSPGQNLIVRPDMAVPIRIEAADDIAIQRVELHQIVDRGADTVQSLPATDGGREYLADAHFDLKSMHAHAGQVIEYYATAYDNDPQGIHNTDSDRYWLWVVTEEDYRKVLEQQRGPSEMITEYRDKIQALQTLTEEQEQLVKAIQSALTSTQSAKGQSSLPQKLSDLHTAQSDLRRKAALLTAQMTEMTKQKPQYDVEADLQHKLTQIVQALRQAQTAMGQAISSPANQMALHAESAARTLHNSLTGPAQNIEQTLKLLERLLPLYHDMARLQELTKAQKQLAQQAQQVRESLTSAPRDDFKRSRLKSLSEQQARNQDFLSQIAQDLESHGHDAMEVAADAAQTALTLSQTIGKLNISDIMGNAQKSLAAFDSSNGAAQALAASKALDSLFNQSQNGKNQCKRSGNGTGLGNSLEQMSQHLGAGVPGPPNGNGSQGGGTGSGNGYQAPTPGSRPGTNGNQANSSQAAIAMALNRPASGSKRSKNNGIKGERFNDLSADNTEKPIVPSQGVMPSAAVHSASRYPPEYRKLVKDYFKSVAGAK